MADDERRRSLARGELAAHGIRLPGLKRDLAAVLLLLACQWFAVMIAPLPRVVEPLVLLLGAVLVCGWLAWRIRRTLRRLAANHGGGHHGAAS